jgi:nitrite reductase/ring-hydroxylating ferredoxin subunit
MKAIHSPPKPAPPKNSTITCPWYGAVNVTTGQVLRLPVPRGISSYSIRLEGMDVEVQL